MWWCDCVTITPGVYDIALPPQEAKTIPARWWWSHILSWTCWAVVQPFRLIMYLLKCSMANIPLICHCTTNPRIRAHAEGHSRGIITLPWSRASRCLMIQCGFLISVIRAQHRGNNKISYAIQLVTRVLTVRTLVFMKCRLTTISSLSTAATTGHNYANLIL